MICKSRILCALLFSLVFTDYCWAAVDVISNRVCQGDTSRFYSLSTVPATALVEWDLNNDGFFDDAIGDSSTRVFSIADTFEVRLRITDSSGIEHFSSPHFVIVDPNPVAGFLVNDTCLGLTTVFVNASQISDGSTLTYQWDFDNNGSVEETTLNTQKQYSSTGNFSLKLRAVSTQNCESQFIRNFVVREVPNADFQFEVACSGEPTVLLNSSTWGSAVPFQAVWYLGDDLVSFLRDTVYHTYSAGDTFDVKLKVTNEYGCTDTVVKQLIIPETVTYSYSFTNGQTFERGSSTEVNVEGQFSSIVWNDNSTVNPRTLTDSGYYVFTLGNSIGCNVVDSFLIQVTTPSDIGLKMANDFLTPNGDGFNDVLFFKNLIYYSNCDLKVFDTRGFEVYKSGSYMNDWDGTKNGKPLNAGTYYFFLKCDDTPELKGATNIIR